MEQKKFLDLNGLKHYNDKLKSGAVVVGRANVANQIQSSGIQWGSEAVPLANIPRAAMERCVVVANQAAMFALTKDQIQNGDTVKVTDGGRMFFVKDDNNLNSLAGYEAYVAGTAASAEIADSVEWSGVKNKPQKFAPEDHGTDVVTSLTGYRQTLPSDLNYAEVESTDTLNQALNKIQSNYHRITQKINIKNLNDSFDKASRLKVLKQDHPVNMYTLVTTTSSRNSEIEVGVLYEFTDISCTNITQVAITSLQLNVYNPKTSGTMRYDMHTPPTIWSRRYKIKSYKQNDEWTDWEPCLSNHLVRSIKRNVMIPFYGIVKNVDIIPGASISTDGYVYYDIKQNKFVYKDDDKYYNNWGLQSYFGETDGSLNVIPFDDVFYYDVNAGGIYIYHDNIFISLTNNSVALTESEIDSIF